MWAVYSEWLFRQVVGGQAALPFLQGGHSGVRIFGSYFPRALQFLQIIMLQLCGQGGIGRGGLHTSQWRGQEKAARGVPRLAAQVHPKSLVSLPPVSHTSAVLGVSKSWCSCLVS